MIAFLTFKCFFIIPITVFMRLQSFLFPLELSCFYIITAFIVLELVFGFFTIFKIV